MLPLPAAGAGATGDTTMSSTQLIEQCVTRLRGIVETLDNIHDTNPHRWSTDLDEVHSSAESLLALINDQAPTQDAQGLAGTALRDSPASVEQAGVDERAVFEFFVRKHCGMPEHIAVNWDAKFTNDAWEGWKARAALARVAELERQGLVDAPGPDEIHQMAFEEGQPAEDGDGYLFSAEEFDLFVQRLLDSCAAPVAQAQHSVPDGYRLIRLEHFAAIKAQLNPEQVDAYRGRNIYDEDKVYANWNACRSALDEIKDVFQQIDWDAENELAELLAAAPGKEGV